jgi:hypothetical protein
MARKCAAASRTMGVQTSALVTTGGAVTPRGEEEAARAGRPLRVAARVVTYNLSDVFPNARKGLLAQTRPLDELIVVDNASTDGTSDMLAAEFPTARQAG